MSSVHSQSLVATTSCLLVSKQLQPSAQSNMVNTTLTYWKNIQLAGTSLVAKDVVVVDLPYCD